MYRKVTKYIMQYRLRATSHVETGRVKEKNLLYCNYIKKTRPKQKTK